MSLQILYVRLDKRHGLDLGVLCGQVAWDQNEGGLGFYSTNNSPSTSYRVWLAMVLTFSGILQPDELHRISVRLDLVGRNKKGWFTSSFFLFWKVTLSPPIWLLCFCYISFVALLVPRELLLTNGQQLILHLVGSISITESCCAASVPIRFCYFYH